MTVGADPVRAFHASTNQARDGRGETVDGFQPMDPENRPEPFKAYEGATRVALPTDFDESSLSAADVLDGRVGGPSGFGLSRLAHLLFFCGGVTRTTERGGRRAYFRTAPSAGNLHPLETYVVVGDMDGLDAGLYHVDYLTFSLDLLRPGDRRSSLAEAAAAPDIATSPATVVVTGITWRTAWKYAERGLRHVYWDTGTMLANLVAVADGTGLPAELFLGFDDAGVADLLGVDGETEFPVVLARLGAPSAASPSTSAAAPASAEPVPSSAPLSPRPFRFPLGIAAHGAGALAGGEAVTQWRAAAAGAPSGDTAFLSEAAPATDGAGIEEVILRRGSTRLFRQESIAREHLEWPLAVATRPIPGDAWASGSLLDLYLSIHSVAGLEPGRYRAVDGKLVLEADDSEEHAREKSQALCCDQPLGGDGAVTVYECVDLEGMLDRLGGRGYRAAQIEAGVIAGRLHLAAYAAGLGATSLTFFDDEVRETFGAQADGMLVTCLGVPDYRSTAGGRPGRTTELRNQEKLMERLYERYQRATKGE